MDNTNNTVAAPVKVEQILATRNPEIFQLQLRQEVAKPAEANPLGFFLEGYPGVGDGVERRVAFQTVSNAFIEKYNVTEGCDFSIAIGKTCKLLVTETFEQRTWTGGEQQPKVNPSSGDVLMQGGRPIYRNCEISFNMEQADTLLAHDKAGVKATSAAPLQMVDDLNS